MKRCTDNPNDVSIPSALSILSLQLVSNPNELKGEFEPLNCKSKRYPFPSAWLIVWLFLLLCHHVSAREHFPPSDGNSEQSSTQTVDYGLDPNSIHQFIHELNVIRLEDTVIKNHSLTSSTTH